MKYLFSVCVCLFGITVLGFTLYRDLQTAKYLNFIAAIENSSTYSYFTVITVKNLNTGETKEICTSGKFVCGALHIELKRDYDNIGNEKDLAFAKSKSDLHFEFKSRKALENISFFDYNTDQLPKIQRMYNFDRVIAIINKEKKFSIKLPDSKMKLFAHVLFNKGYMTGESDCFGGTLDYVDQKKKE